MNNVSEGSSDFVQNLGEAVRKNPVSAALIGMGVLWLFTGGRPVEMAGDVARGAGLDRIPDDAGHALDTARTSWASGSAAVGERAASAAGVIRYGVGEVVDRAGRYGRVYADSASDYVASVPGSGAEMLRTVRSNLSDVFRAQPLALGAVGIAIGAGIAAALPATEVEADYLGEASDAVKETAVQFASEQADRMTTVAGSVVEAVKQEAEDQGLTLDSARAASGDISAKMGRVMDAAGQSVKRQPKLQKPQEGSE